MILRSNVKGQGQLTHRNIRVNTIETEQLRASSSNLADMLIMVRG